MRNSLALVFLSTLVASSAHATLTPPALHWRAVPVAIDISPDQNNLLVNLQPWLTGEEAGFQPTITTTTNPWVAFQAGGTVNPNTPWMITFGSLYNRVSSSNGVGDNPNCQMTNAVCSTDVTLLFEQSAVVTQNNNAPTTGWSTVGTFQSYQQLDQFTLSVNPNRWYRITVQLAPTSSRTTNNVIYVTDFGLYDLSGSAPKDYWLMLGASIEVQSISNKDWKANAKAFFGADPVVFNMSRGGWLSTQLVANLDHFLAMHPNARYCAVHIGGNNVSFYRPWPGGSQLLEDDLNTILTKVVQAGKIPVISRITYRHYPSPNPVDPPTYPQANGSLPYVENIVDPFIQKYNPDFYDSTRQRGYMDGYAWFRANPNYLRDGTHLTPEGITVWQTLWVQRPGTLIYGTEPNCTVPNNPCLPAIPDCGNGIIEAGEECDDANRDPNDGCSNNCVKYTGQNAESLTPTAQIFCPDGSVYPGTCASGSGSGGNTDSSTSSSSVSTASVNQRVDYGCAASPVEGYWALLAVAAGWASRRRLSRHRSHS